jgi:hypothetical protein
MQRKSMMSNRRQFLKQAGLITGAGSLLAMMLRPTANEKAADRGRKGRGYRLTAHIRSYYQKAGG